MRYPAWIQVSCDLGHRSAAHSLGPGSDECQRTTHGRVADLRSAWSGFFARGQSIRQQQTLRSCGSERLSIDRRATTPEKPTWAPSPQPSPNSLVRTSENSIGESTLSDESQN